MDMEQITINVTGKNAQEKAARLMRSIYKTMAKINDQNCHITITSQREKTEQDGVSVDIPKFMQPKELFVRGRI